MGKVEELREKGYEEISEKNEDGYNKSLSQVIDLVLEAKANGKHVFCNVGDFVIDSDSIVSKEKTLRDYIIFVNDAPVNEKGEMYVGIAENGASVTSIIEQLKEREAYFEQPVYTIWNGVILHSQTATPDLAQQKLIAKLCDLPDPEDVNTEEMNNDGFSR